MKDIKVGIIGSGFGMYGLVPAFNKTKNSHVVSICGKKSERMSKYCKKFNLKHYTNWKKMINEEKPDAVAIAVIPIYQYEIAKYALEHDIAVFAEKPLTNSYETSLELFELAKIKNLPNMMDFIFPEIPEWSAAKKIIEKNLHNLSLELNVKWDFLSYDSKLNLKTWKTDKQLGGGALSFFFSHTLYYLEFFLGRIKDITCKIYPSKTNSDQEMSISMDILFQNGCVGNVVLNSQNKDNSCHTLEFSGKNFSLILKNINTYDQVTNFELMFNGEIISQKTDKLEKSSEDE